MAEDLNFVLCVNNGYAHYIAVTIKSICENHKENRIVIHVFTNYISDTNRNLLYEVIDPYEKVQIKFQIVDDRGLKGLKESWSIYAWYRILAPALLPHVKRCLYLDADTVVCNNLSDLFSMPMQNCGVAGVIDVENFHVDTRKRCNLGEEDIYFCSGILLMNLEYWRTHDFSNEIIRWAKENDTRIKFPDQDTINILCKDNKIVLPIKYGVQNIFFKDARFYQGQLKAQLTEAFQSPSIIHYAGCAPWITEFSNNPLHGYWMKYNNMLKHKVRIRYMTKGINGIKVRLWRMMNSYDARIEMKQIEEKLHK